MKEIFSSREILSVISFTEYNGVADYQEKSVLRYLMSNQMFLAGV
jgi:hypothetical protein